MIMEAQAVDGFVTELPHQFIDAVTGEDVTEEVMNPLFNRLTSTRIVRQIISEFEESQTQQQFLDSTDVQKIYERCLREGISPLDLTGNGPGQFGDVSELQGSTLTELYERAQATMDVVSDAMANPPVVEDAPAEQAAVAPVVPPVSDTAVPPS